MSMKGRFYCRACCYEYSPWRVKWERAMADLEKVEACVNCTAQINGNHGPQISLATQLAATSLAPPPPPPPPPFPPWIATLVAAVELLQEENQTLVSRLEVVRQPTIGE